MRSNSGRRAPILLALAFGVVSSRGESPRAESHRGGSEWHLPIAAADRQSLRGLRITPIGDFGRPRKARPRAPAHLHAGLDFMRPGSYSREAAVHPIGPGVVISVRDDGPFAQIMVAHGPPGKAGPWSVYEHVAGIKVRPGDKVTPQLPMARFMTRAELDRYGWQFDHLHLEILKTAPKAIRPTERLPHRRFSSYNLGCRNEAELAMHFADPARFLDSAWRASSLGKASDKNGAAADFATTPSP